ncbi:Gfo/Idh/MocA family protein [Brachybacterium saurashtrense]|uniref:Gfo/Idh/MocA family oxidoreductase n=1 Tax=Brachybacterium saurashtrense TaxID=556288 RepID=A0A345YRE1_9MICO|nr:Gfo/Idh/MocA family oxidoreductase [Brachybacterium saurashtrense]AXK46493.1 gfo/Idh/MocA family oxidoreductase [Brachybacterium saurashtrense]RRR24234.1 gfo/Idh/MocA family oxidoreductase [Brachybacterium saurashtrense]
MLTTLPAARIHHPHDGEPSLRWGVVGPGWIAGEFVRAVHAHSAQRVVAVGSRDLGRARAFADAHGIDRAHGEVEALLADPEVDVVYIATPHSEHAAIGLAAIALGKHVLIEKPITVSAAEARELSAAARAAGVLVMEAMWTRYLPQTSVLRSLLDSGELGDVRSASADHGQRIIRPAEHRMYDPELGGGALLDLGVYPAQFLQMVLGAPTALEVRGTVTATGVDANAAVVSTHADGAVSTLYTSLLERTPTTATIAGTEAFVHLDGPFYNPTSFTVESAAHGAPSVRWQDPTMLRGFAALSYEATALARYAGEGRVESPEHTHEETIAVMEMLETARTQVLAAGVLAPPQDLASAPPARGERAATAGASR